MGRSRCDACCDCLSLCGLYWVVAWLGVVEVVVWAALQPLLLITGKPEHIPCGSPEGFAAENPNSTNLKIVIPSVGGSGTTSLHTALCMMGFRSYHAEERASYLRETLVDDASAEAIARSVSRCQADALFLEPTSDIFPRFLEVSPGARIIMTWRDFPSYYTSVVTHLQPLQDRLTSGLNYLCTFPVNMLRWEDWFDLVSGGMLDDAWRRAPPFGCIGYVEYVFLYAVPRHFHLFVPENNLFDRGSMKVYLYEEAFLAAQSEIRRLVPPDNLLVFDVKRHGWKDLEDFLGASAGELSKTPFPNPRKSNYFTHNHILMNNPKIHVVFYTFTVLLIVAEIRILLPLLRFLRPFLCFFCCRRHTERWRAKPKAA